jgi:integrase
MALPNRAGGASRFARRFWEVHGRRDRDVGGYSVVQAERMKARVEHRIPWSKQALAVLRQADTQKVNDVVFSGQKPGRALSNMALLMMLRRMDRDDLTAHGFRSTFRDWAAEAQSAG